MITIPHISVPKSVGNASTAPVSVEGRDAELEPENALRQRQTGVTRSFVLPLWPFRPLRLTFRSRSGGRTWWSGPAVPCKQIMQFETRRSRTASAWGFRRFLVAHRGVSGGRQIPPRSPCGAFPLGKTGRQPPSPFELMLVSKICRLYLPTATLLGGKQKQN